MLLASRDFPAGHWVHDAGPPGPGDYVIATGETHSVREFAELAFSCVGLDYRGCVVVNEDLFRPSEVNLLLGEPSKARKELGWRHKTWFEDLVLEMVVADCKAAGAVQPPSALAASSAG